MSTVRELEGRVGIVTGAGRGIGRETARALTARGMHLAVVARTGADVRALADELSRVHGVSVLPAATDVRDRAAVERLLALVEQHLGPIDLVVNNAGVIERQAQRLWETPWEEVRDVVRTNLEAPLLLCHAVVPALVARGRGHVVHVASSGRAAEESRAYGAYAVSKRAASALTQVLAGQLAGTGVVAVDVLPGLVRTALTDAIPVWQGLPDDAWTPPSATARVVADVAAGRYDDRAGQVLDARTLPKLG